MLARKVDDYQIDLAIERANVKYQGNLTRNTRGIDWRTGGYSHDRSGNPRFTLSVRDSRGPGHRLTWDGYSGKQHRLACACWHAYRDFMIELFRLAPEATLVTGLATYRGRADFEAKFPDTYYRNAGSQMMPAHYGSLCECADDRCET